MFPADSEYSNGNNLCPCSRWHISLLIWSRIYTVFALNREETVGVSVQFHIQVHRWYLVHKQPRVWESLGQMYPVEPEIKDTAESNTSASYLDLLLSIGRDGQLHNSIYDKRDYFNFHITNCPFLSSNIQPRPPMASLFHSLYDMPGLAPRMDFLSWGRRDFQISFSNRDMSRNAWNRHLGSFMVDTGMSSNKIFPLTNVKWHSVTWPYTMTTPYWSDFVPNSTFYRILSGFHRTFATGVACRLRTITPPYTWSRPFGTCICSTCWD